MKSLSFQMDLSSTDLTEIKDDDPDVREKSYVHELLRHTHEIEKLEKLEFEAIEAAYSLNIG
jgi:hypothetical protein